MGPKSVCTKNGPTRVSPLQTALLPTMVTLVWGGGGVRGGYPPLLRWCTAILILLWGWATGCTAFTDPPA